MARGIGGGVDRRARAAAFFRTRGRCARAGVVAIAAMIDDWVFYFIFYSRQELINMNKWIKVGLLLVPALLMSACGSTNVKKKEGAPVTGGAAPSQDGAPATPFGGGGEGAVTSLSGVGGSALSGVVLLF